MKTLDRILTGEDIGAVGEEHVLITLVREAIRVDVSLIHLVVTLNLISNSGIHGIVQGLQQITRT